MSMPLETNGNTSPLNSTSAANGCDISAPVKLPHSTDEINAIDPHGNIQTQDTHVHNRPQHDQITPNGVSASNDHQNNNKMNDEKPQEHTTQHTAAVVKAPAGASSPPPTEHKQHSHLPLRKRHLLASSTATAHHENESDHHIPTTPTGTSIPNPLSTELFQERKSTDNITNTIQHTEPPDPPEIHSSQELHKQNNINNNNNNNNNSTNNHITNELKNEPHDIQHNNSANESTTPRERKHSFTKDEPHSHQSHSHSHSHSSQSHSHSHSSQSSHSSHSPHSHSSDTHHHHHHHQHHSSSSPQLPSHQSHFSPQQSPRSHLSQQSQQHPHHSSSSSSHSQSHFQSHQPPPNVKSSSYSSHSPSIPHSPSRPVSPPSRTNSPTSTAHVVRNTSSRGRGAGRGRGKSKVEASSHHSVGVSHGSEREELYCFCRRPYDPTVDVFMICCDECDEWYHGSCVGVNQKEAKKIGRYVCPRCKKIPIPQPSQPSSSSSELSDDEPASPPLSSSSSIGPHKSKKRKHESATFKTEPKRQAVSPSLSDNGVESPGHSEARGCLNCDKQAMPKSKYCSNECGLEFARRQYLNSSSGSVNGGNTTSSSSNGKKPISATEIADKEALDEIAKKKADIADKLAKLAKEQGDLDKAMQFARNADSSPSSRPTSPSIAPDNVPAASASDNTTIDCASCGHPIAVSKYTIHMERCFHKKENNVLMVGTTSDGGAVYCNVYDQKSKTFCKKLKHACAAHAAKRAQANGLSDTTSSGSNSNGVIANGQINRKAVPLICGCPTSDFASGYCELTRKGCVKHHNWEELMRDSISNQRTQHNKILASLEGEEHAVRMRMSRRTQTTAASHRTIEEA